MASKNKHADLGEPDGAGTPPPANGEGGSGELEKIRSILFGEQLRSTEDRLANLEKRLLAKMSEVHKAIETRLDALEQTLEDRTRDIGELQFGLKDQKNEIHSELKSIDEALRESIESTSSTLTQEFEAKTETLSHAVEHSIDRIQKEKVNRGQLSALLSQLAKSLEE